MIQNLQSEFREHLHRGENLIWTGKPKAGIVFRTTDFFMIPFSLLWLGFSIFWVVNASKMNMTFAMFGIPFVIIGLIFAFGRFIIDSKQRENTVYGLTENRILIKTGVFSKNIQSLNISTLSNIELSEKGDGTGTISIGPKNPFKMGGNGMNGSTEMPMSTQLELIANARKVYNQIIEIQNKK